MPLPRRRVLLELAAVAAVLLAAVVLVCATVFRAVVVEGQSMAPTLHDGDRLLVNVYAYRGHTPARGEIIVFRSPGPVVEEYVKRVVGLAGETVAILDGQVYVDGRILPERYVQPGDQETLGSLVVPAGCVFVLGDNRAHSTDSRLWGPLPLQRIDGRARCVVWPPADLAVL